MVWKRKGLFSKHRMLILTDKPRLIYVDPATMVLKGEIPWAPQHPVRCTPVRRHIQRDVMLWHDNRFLNILEY